MSISSAKRQYRQQKGAGQGNEERDKNVIFIRDLALIYKWDNMELVDTLAEASEEDPLAVSKMVRLILGNEKRKLYDSLRTEDGRVPVEAVSNALKEIFESFGEKGKN